MSRLYKSVLWTLAICVLGGLAVTLMILEAPKPVQAQPLPDPQPLKSPSLPAPAELAEPAVDGPTVIYSIKSPDVIKVIPQLKEKLSGKANMFFDERTSALVVRASEEAHADIRAALSQLDGPDALEPEFAVDGPTVIYSIKSPDVIKLLPLLKEKFSGKANIFLDERTSALVVRASEQTHAEIRGALSQFNDRYSAQFKSTPPLAADPFAQTGELPELSALDRLTKGLGAAEHQRQIADAVKGLRQAQSEEETNKVKDHLRQLLANAFAADMAARQQQAAEIEARLSKLRDQYKAREELKDEIIDLQLRALALAAAGIEEASNATGAFPQDKGPAENNLYVPRGESGFTPFEPLNKLSDSRVKSRGSSYQDRSLQDLKKTLPTVVNDLTNLGHFMESPDGKFYVYVNSNHPHGPSYIRVVDSATGKMIATAVVPAVVGPLGLTDEGVVTQEGESGTPLRIPRKHLHSSDAELDPGPTLSNQSLLDLTAKTDTGRPATISGSSLLAQYNELRAQYQMARAAVAQAEAQFNVRLAELQKEQPEANLDDVKKQNAEAWNSVEAARVEFEAAKQLLETQVKLLDLDRRAAIAAVETAQSELNRLQQLLEQKVVPPVEVEAHSASLQSAEINLERANTLYEFFRSIGEQAPQDPQPTEAAADPAKPTEDAPKL